MVNLVFWEAFHSEVELAQLVQEGLEQVPGDDWVEVDFGDFVGKNGVVVFPTFLDTEQEVLDSVRVFEFVKSGPVDELVIKSLGTHIVFNFKLFLYHIEFRKSIGKLGSLINLIKVVVVQTVNVESLTLSGLLILDCLLQFIHQIPDQFFRVLR